MAKINVQNTEITVVSHNDDDYISLTGMARSQLQEHIIFRWLSLKSTIDYINEITDGVFSVCAPHRDLFQVKDCITKCQTPCDNKAVTNQSVLK